VKFRFFLPRFYSFSDILEVDQDLRVIGQATAPPGYDFPLAVGFWVRDPEVALITCTPSGPMFVRGSHKVLINAETALSLTGAGDERNLKITVKGQPVLEVPAPRPKEKLKEFPEEPELTDFYLWFTDRLQREDVQREFTNPIGSLQNW
jgi:hypothetical protein